MPNDCLVFTARRIGSVAWLLTVQFFLCAAIAGAYAVPHYEGTRQVLSDLGVRECVHLPSVGYFCSPAHTLFALSLFLQGTCMMVGAILLQPLIRDRVALGCCLIAGASLYGIAAVPENTNFTIHVVLAGVHCVAANGWLARLAVARPAMAEFPAIDQRIFAGLAVIGSAASVALLFESTIRPYTGFIERLAVYPFPLALILCAYLLLRRDLARQ